jgi:hypothetical protein
LSKIRDDTSLTSDVKFSGEIVRPTFLGTAIHR